MKRLYTGGRWSEGPVWVGDERYVLWSDIPNDRILRWSETTGQVDEFRKRQASPTASPVTAKGAWSPASTAGGA